MQRAADLARTFEGESPRAFATLAVARTVWARPSSRSPRERAGELRRPERDESKGARHLAPRPFGLIPRAD